MNGVDLKNGTCPIHNRLRYPAVVESAKICAELKRKCKEREAIHREQLEITIMLNSFITAIVVFVLLLLTVPIGGEVFLIAAIIALLPWLLYKIERGIENARQ